MADLFIIGQFEGPGSITAVSMGSQVMNMVTVMIVGLAMGTTVNIGRSIGADRRDLAAKFTGNTLTLFLGGSLVLAALLLGLVALTSSPQSSYTSPQPSDRRPPPNLL